LAENPDPSEHTDASVYLQMKRSMTCRWLQDLRAPDTADKLSAAGEFYRGAAGVGSDDSEFSAGQARQFAARIAKQAGESGEACGGGA